MRDTLLITISTGKEFNQLCQYTHKTLIRYAIKYDFDFQIINNYRKHIKPGFAKFEIKELLNKYKQIVYIDSDIIIRPDSPNILDSYKPGTFMAYPEYNELDKEQPEYCERKKAFADYCTYYCSIIQAWQVPNLKDFHWYGKYYNTGVFVVDKECIQVFEEPVIEVDHFQEQSHINFNIAYNNIPTTDLYHGFNSMGVNHYKFTNEDNKWFIHFAGQYKKGERLNNIKETYRGFYGDK